MSNCKYFIINAITIMLMHFSPITIALTIDESRHLLSRTGFAPSFVEIEPYLALTHQQAIQTRIRTLNAQAQTKLPDIYHLPYTLEINFKTATREEKQAYRKKLRQQMLGLKTWWTNEMLTTTSPFTENLTLFWHNHFVSSAQKVKQPALMANQNNTLRQFSSANFGAFLQAMLQDPALLQYLDNTKNKKDKLNENLARELLELFTLGEGHYTETEIKQVAKILTGYGIKRQTGEYQFYKTQHDNSNKTIFNQTGNWDARDLTRIIIQNPQTAKFITKKLWNHFITTPIPKNILKKLSHLFYQNYEIKPLIQNILTQPEFWDIKNVGTKIKDPTNLAIGIYRQFKAQPSNLIQIVSSITQMGQNLLTPPNVKGWNTGNSWINTTTLLARQTFIDNATRGNKLKNNAQKFSKNDQAWLDLLIPKTHQTKDMAHSSTWNTIEKALQQPSYQLE